MPRLTAAQKKAAAAARAEAQRAKKATQRAAAAAAQGTADGDGSEEATALAPPPKPASLREASKIFDPKKVGGYRPVPCLRCARSMLTCALPGRFCFAYGSSGRYAHCVKGKHTCVRPADASAELVVPAKYLSLASLQWYHASVSAPGPIPRPENLVKVGETFSRRDQRVIAARGGVQRKGVSAAGLALAGLGDSSAAAKTNRLLRRLIALTEAQMVAADVDVPEDLDDGESVVGA